MRFGPTRGHILSVFQNFFKDFGLFLIAIVVSIFLGKDFLRENMVVFLFTLIRPISKLYQYIFTTYSVDEEKMIVKKGLITKTKMEIPLKVITTVDFSQNIIYQMGNVYSVKIDNASQTQDTAKQAEVTLSLKKDQAILLKQLLSMGKKENASEQQDNRLEHEMETTDANLIITKPIDFFLLGLFQSKLLYLFSVGMILYSVFLFLNTIIQKSNLEKIPAYHQFITLVESWLDTILGWFLSNQGNLVNTIFIVIMLWIPFYLIGLLSSVLTTMVKYYNFRVTNREESLRIEFGFFTKKTYSLMKEKISGVSYHQSLLMRIFGYGTVNVLVIGYGDNSEDGTKELSMLFPLLRKKEFAEIMKLVLPEMEILAEYDKPMKKTLRYFFYCFRFTFCVGGVVGSIISKDKIFIAVAVVLFVIAIVSVVMEYRSSGIYATHKTISICQGGIGLNYTFIKTEKLESITEASLFLKRRKGITNIGLGFLAPTRVSSVRVRNMSMVEFEKVQSVLYY